MAGERGGMPYADFLNAIIDDGEAEVRATYLRPDQALKRDGCLRGFGECRGKTPDELATLLVSASGRCAEALRRRADDYWYWRCRAAQIEWVLNVLSAAEYAHGRRPHIPPTCRGLQKAAGILGIRPSPEPSHG